jgi:hypothetical protein
MQTSCWQLSDGGHPFPSSNRLGASFRQVVPAWSVLHMPQRGELGDCVGSRKPNAVQLALLSSCRSSGWSLRRIDSVGGGEGRLVFLHGAAVAETCPIMSSAAAHCPARPARSAATCASEPQPRRAHPGARAGIVSCSLHTTQRYRAAPAGSLALFNACAAGNVLPPGFRSS